MVANSTKGTLNSVSNAPNRLACSLASSPVYVQISGSASIAGQYGPGWYYFDYMDWYYSAVGSAGLSINGLDGEHSDGGICYPYQQNVPMSLGSVQFESTQSYTLYFGCDGIGAAGFTATAPAGYTVYIDGVAQTGRSWSGYEIGGGGMASVIRVSPN
jgi:hypothetical protein